MSVKESIKYIKVGDNSGLDKDKVLSFVYNSILKSNRSTGINTSIDNDIYYTEESKKLKNILNDSDVVVIVNKDDYDQFLGYCVYKDDTIHFVYVKYNFRKLGIVKDLVNSLGLLTDDKYTYITYYPKNKKQFESLQKKYNVKFNPYKGGE